MDTDTENNEVNAEENEPQEITVNETPADTGGRVEVVGVRYKKAGMILYVSPDGHSLRRGDAVIVEDKRGVLFGKIEVANKFVDQSEIVQPFKKIMRVATEADREQHRKNLERKAEAAAICRDKISAHKLDETKEMKLVDVEFTFDLNKIIVYYTANGRVDYNDLVKDLAPVFRMRVEMKQIYQRDEPKFTGGMGICGREICCASFSDKFVTITVKMAKDQNLPTKLEKISGICGYLRCCIKYEASTYEELNKNLPGKGERVKTPDGEGDVVSVSVLQQLVRVAVKTKKDEVAVNTYPVKDIKVLKPEKEQKKAAEAFPERSPDGEAAAETADVSINGSE